MMKSYQLSLCILDGYKREGQVNSLLRKPLCLSCLCHSQSHSAEDRQAGRYRPNVEEKRNEEKNIAATYGQYKDYERDLHMISSIVKCQPNTATTAHLSWGNCGGM